MREVSEGDDATTVDVTVGESFEVRLAENPTTGFRWHLDHHDPCRLERDWFEPSSGAPGRAGTHHWRFTADAAGVGQVQLTHRRPWGTPPGSGRTIAVTVRVGAD